jgi:hypothetical protein
MLVFYRLAGRRRRSAYPVYAQTRVVFCCVAMKRQWCRSFGFGAKDCKASKDKAMNLYTARPRRKQQR